MKLSIFTTQTNSGLRGDNVADALECYTELADETIIVDGSFPESQNGQLTQDGDKEHPEFLMHHWPKEFKWPFIGEQFQRGYEACTGDWVIHADLDHIYHEDDYDQIREVLSNHNDQPAVSFLKRQFILPDRFNLKSRLIVAVNKGKFGDRIRFDSGGDLCQPSLDGKYIEPGTVPDIKIPIWNYEKILKTKEQIMDDVGRMERAYRRHFGKTQYGSDGKDEDAYNHWLKAQKGKLDKPQEAVRLEDHPKVMQETIRNLRPDQWGYNGFGLKEKNHG